MNVIYGQVGTLTKLILPGSDISRSSPPSSPLQTTEVASSTMSTVFIETSKSRHTSVTSQVNPLLCVKETEEVEPIDTLSNGLLEQHLAEKQLASPLSLKQSPAVDPQQEQQHQQGSSCVIS
jgi:hypothetical protein